MSTFDEIEILSNPYIPKGWVTMRSGNGTITCYHESGKHFEIEPLKPLEMLPMFDAPSTEVQIGARLTFFYGVSISRFVSADTPPPAVQDTEIDPARKAP